jgi:hypothetical protein
VPTAGIRCNELLLLCLSAINPSTCADEPVGLFVPEKNTHLDNYAVHSM